MFPKAYNALVGRVCKNALIRFDENTFLFRFFFFSCSCHANWPSIRALGSSAGVFSSESLKSLPESKPPSVSSNNCSKQTPSGAEGGSLTSLLTSSLMLRRSFAFSSIT